MVNEIYIFNLQGDYLYGHFPNLKKKQLEKILIEFTKTNRLEKIPNFYKIVFDLYHQGDDGFIKSREFIIEKLINEDPVDVSKFLETDTPIDDLDFLIENKKIKIEKVRDEEKIFFFNFKRNL